jgi:hypothetical protein
MQKHRLRNEFDPSVADVEGGRRSIKPKPSLKAKLYEEAERFLMIFAYLWLVFVVFLVHEWIVLADNHIGFKFLRPCRN